MKWLYMHFKVFSPQCFVIFLATRKFFLKGLKWQSIFFKPYLNIIYYYIGNYYYDY